MAEEEFDHTRPHQNQMRARWMAEVVKGNLERFDRDLRDLAQFFVCEYRASTP